MNYFTYQAIYVYSIVVLPGSAYPHQDILIEKSLIPSSTICTYVDGKISCNCGETKSGAKTKKENHV